MGLDRFSEATELCDRSVTVDSLGHGEEQTVFWGLHCRPGAAVRKRCGGCA